MKNTSHFVCIGLGFICILIIIIAGTACKTMQDKNYITRDIIDSFEMSMDEYRIIDSQMQEKLDSLINRIENEEKATYAVIPIYISISTIKNPDYYLFKFWANKAYILEFPHPNEAQINLVSDPGFGVMRYKNYLIKFGGFLESYSYSDGKSEKMMVESTGRKLTFKVFGRRKENGMWILDFSSQSTVYYHVKNGEFKYLLSQ